MNDKGRVIEALATSTVFKRYRAAFHEAIGVQLIIEPPAEGASFSQLADVDHRRGVQWLSEGLYRAAIPICDGVRVVAMLCTFPLTDGTATKVEAVAGFSVLPMSRFLPYLSLLTIFAEHLGALSNRLVLLQAHCEPAVVMKARHFIETRFHEPIELQEVARHAGVSTFYLCKLFKKTTGINFSNYVTRRRVEVAKEQLHKPTLRISEVALQVGFQSLSHFNRVFKKLVGTSPREYRRQLRSNEPLRHSNSQP